VLLSLAALQRSFHVGETHPRRHCAAAAGRGRRSPVPMWPETSGMRGPVWGGMQCGGTMRADWRITG